MKRGFVLLITMALCMAAQAQQAYWIYFRDKQHTPYSVDAPEAFLSAESIARRKEKHIRVREFDLPVDPSYIEAVKATGAHIRVTSKWLNAVSVTIDSPEQLALLGTLDCVTDISEVKRYAQGLPSVPLNDQQLFRTENKTDETSGMYGSAENQINMIGVDFLHSAGYRGQGIVIAVLDGGFAAVDTGVGFISLYDKGQIAGVYNVAEGNENVFLSTTHGSNVLSIMAVDKPGIYVGSAPDATYWLIKTEVVESEFIIEEDYWLAGAEFADSVGADIINSSLGYTTFDDSTQDHVYSDLDGNTTVVTRAADMAAAAGILVVNSAGNEGNSTWRYIGAPADGDSVFTIGAVDVNGVIANFSSVGPTADGRIKPNVVCQGAGAAVMNGNGTVGFGSGTSYSSPLLAGACASFMSAFPELTNMEVIERVQASADRYAFPNDTYGYGIPSFANAYIKEMGIQLDVNNQVTILPNPATTELTVYVHGLENEVVTLILSDITGRQIASDEVIVKPGIISATRFSGLEMLASGIYLVRMTGTAYEESHLVYVQ